MLLLVKVGNMSTADLKAIFTTHFNLLIEALQTNDVVILRKNMIENSRICEIIKE